MTANIHMIALWYSRWRSSVYLLFLLESFEVTSLHLSSRTHPSTCFPRPRKAYVYMYNRLNIDIETKSRKQMTLTFTGYTSWVIDGNWLYPWWTLTTNKVVIAWIQWAAFKLNLQKSECKMSTLENFSNCGHAYFTMNHGCVLFIILCELIVPQYGI